MSDSTLRGVRNIWASLEEHVGKNRLLPALAILLSMLGSTISSTVLAADEIDAPFLELDPTPDSPQRTPPRDEGPRRVFRDRVTPHWFGNGAKFWYRNELRAEREEFVVVDAERGVRGPAFDHARLAEALSKSTGASYSGDKLPFNAIEFVDEGKALRFKVGDDFWKCVFDRYECSKSEPESAEKKRLEGAVTPRRPSRQTPSDDEGENDSPDRSQDRSPDGRWIAFVKTHNVFIKPRSGDGSEVQLSEDGREGLGYGRFSWSPDSKTLTAFRIEPGERKEVYLIESSPKEGGRAKMRARPYPLPGDKFPTYELNLFDIAARKQTKPAVDQWEHEWLRPQLHWYRDGRRFAYQQVDRGHQRLRVVEVEADTAKTRNVVDEKSTTFIWTAHTENLNLNLVNYLTNTDEIVYVSESNGWRHLYLVDAAGGGSLNPITTGSWVVRGIDLIDEAKREVWFRASGVFPDQDPYFLHFGRVKFDGTGLVFFTAANGNHAVQFSPDRKYAVDTYSRVDAAPVNELRSTADGKLICGLEEADIADLKANDCRVPEVFVAKGRDGATDIWGIICRPRDFDPRKNYPVIEDIYAGPQGSFVPKTFSAAMRYDSLTKLGFIVVKIDGMGTANRSKAFHDVCWHNLKDAGFPDRILWTKAAAQKYPQMDLTRVGVYGTSAGAQNAAGALLFHGDFYKAAVANCGCHDNRMDKASWNEQWMGYPVGPHYSECSNIDNAARLRGRLFLIVGELDDNVPPESTLRFTDALIKAGKDFDFLLVPGGGHGAGGAYGQRRLQDFFARNLLGVEPPERNAEAQPKP
jgi:dipeptidyl aminopeptidase/acylaminoacyl peptidase